MKYIKLFREFVPHPTYNPLIKNFKGFKKLYDNKKESLLLDDFISGEIKKKYPYLEFRDNGDIDFDKRSREPHFVAYNNVRLEISEAFKRKDTSLTWNFSNAVWEALQKDGYYLYMLKEVNDRGHRHGMLLIIER